MAGTVVGDDRIEVKSSFFGLCKTAVYQPTGSKLTAVILEFPQDRAGELNRIMQTPDEELPAVCKRRGNSSRNRSATSAWRHWYRQTNSLPQPNCSVTTT